MASTGLVLSKLPLAVRSGQGWSARCPAHEDHHASLSISEGDDKRALLRCHAGCPTESVVEALGLRMSDLMPVETVNVNETSRNTASEEVSLTTRSKKPSQTYATAQEAVTVLESQHGPKSDWWAYHDASGDPIGTIVRWDRPAGGKVIRPVSRNGNGWIIAGMPEPRQLYRLPELQSAERVYVTEGEKAADAARSIGLTATTSPHGAKSSAKADWSPLAGKEVVLLPDNDEPGRAYAREVAKILSKLRPAPNFKTVVLPDLPPGGDMADWVQAQEGVAPEDQRSRLDTMADEAVASPANTVESFLEWRPFPVDALPEPVRGFVLAGAKAIGCDASFVALPLLTVLASAIGNTRRIQLKRGWAAPSILWCAIVGESGSAKSPAFKLAMRPLRERQRKALERHEEALREHFADMAHHEKQLSGWRRTKQTTQDPPEKPVEPVAERYIVSDTTVEALAPLLLGNPRGLLLARDELAGWLGSFDRYAGKGGADASHWLSMFNAEQLIVDRKTGRPRTIYVPAAAVSVCGGIQPTILNRALGTEHRESGLAARMLLASPPRKAKRWTEADIDPRLAQQIATLVEFLFQLEPAVDADGQPCPVIIKLSPEAKTIWKAFYNGHAQEQAGLSGDLSAAWSKLEEYAARLALVIHCTRAAAGDPTLSDPDVMDSVSMEAGLRLVTWFKHETRRVYSLLSESDEERSRRRLAEWISQRGGVVTAREVQQNYRALRASGAAEAALQDLVGAGIGIWTSVHTTKKGGRPSRKFQLTAMSTVNETLSDAPEEEGFVDVDNVADPELEVCHDMQWGGDLTKTTNDTVVEELLRDLRSAGIKKIVPHGDRLKYCPKSAMPPELGQRVHAHKPDLMVALSNGSSLAESHESSSDVLGIQARLQGDELSRICPSQDVRDAIEADREQLEASMQEMSDAATENDWPRSSVDPGKPCATCGSLDKWWDIVGGEHCQRCERDKVLRSQRIARRAAQLRKRSTAR